MWTEDWLFGEFKRMDDKGPQSEMLCVGSFVCRYCMAGWSLSINLFFFDKKKREPSQKAATCWSLISVEFGERGPIKLLGNVLSF